VSRRTAVGAQYTISTIAGNGESGATAEGVQANATALLPTTLAVDQGMVYAASRSRHTVHRVDRAGIITRFAGTGTFGFSGDGSAATAARLNSPQGVAVDNQGRVYIVDSSNNRVRLVAGATISTIAGPDDRVGGQAFGAPRAIAARADGRMIVFALARGFVVVAPNQVTSAFGTQPPATTVTGVAADSQNNYYASDSGAHVVFRVNPLGERTVIAGNGIRGFNGDKARATDAALNAPGGVAVDAEGNVYFTDTANHRVRMITREGALRTIAGTGEAGFAGDGGPSTLARLNRPSGIAVDAEGSVYVADEFNRRLRKLTRVRAPLPAVSDNSFVHAADGSDRHSPGGLFSLFGDNLALGEALASGAPWPEGLAGASVFINDRPAPLYFNNGRQINGQIPFETQPGAAIVRAEVAGARGREIRVNIIPAAPGILQFGDRRAVAVNADGTINTQASPTAPGSAIVVYLTGIGAVDNPVATGAAASANPLSRPVAAFSATLGDAEVQVLFLGLAPGFVGLAQANLVIPKLPPGDYLLVIVVNGVPSNAVFVTVG
jgi:uncharacterized protein (TIGR03437 family)